MNLYENAGGDTSAALSVSELNEYARRLLAGDPLLRNLQVTGEISGYKYHYSGHRYFVLKDVAAKVQCVMFRQQAMSLGFQPVDGMRVTVRASASIFPRDGSYQLYVNSMQKAGIGDLYARFEKLKQKLSAEGLFDPALKQPVPFMPAKIGIVTSETGAAIRDIIQVARRRNPGVEILVAPCAVQGASAAREIAEAIGRLNRNAECDVLLVGRGGGSIEDLWAFNEEIVARAIAASKIPVISCVGHEIDFTIADFVADLRAPTPSAAAELAVPVLADLKGELDGMLERLAGALAQGIRMHRVRIESLDSSKIFTDPIHLITSTKRESLDQISRRMLDGLGKTAEKCADRLRNSEIALRTLDPSTVLERGYAVVEKDEGLVTGIGDICSGMRVRVRLSDGSFSADVAATAAKDGMSIYEEKD